MALSTKVEKFKDIQLSNYCSDPWEGSPRGGDASEADQLVKDRRQDIVKYGEIDYDDASYSYDDFSLIHIKGAGWFLLETSGCSCPSPDETWTVLLYKTTLLGLKKAFIKYISDLKYGVAIDQQAQFMELFEFAREQTRTKKGQK